jgi:hypothetical protein
MMGDEEDFLGGELGMARDSRCRPSPLRQWSLWVWSFYTSCSRARTEAHHSVQAEKLFFCELEFVLRSQRLAVPVHQAKQRLKEGCGALVVGIGIAWIAGAPTQH